MKKSIVAAVVLTMVIAMGGMAMAAGTQTVAVTATVTGVCQFLTGGAINFTLDPSVGGNVNGTVTQPTFWCTNGTTYTITDNGGLYNSAGTRRMLHGTADYIPYSFTYTASAAGAGRTVTLTMDIASTVVGADYVNAAAGAYADTVTLTINP